MVGRDQSWKHNCQLSMVVLLHVDCNIRPLTGQNAAPLDVRVMLGLACPVDNRLDACKCATQRRDVEVESTGICAGADMLRRCSVKLGISPCCALL
jgi:hypothetical protein